MKEIIEKIKQESKDSGKYFGVRFEMMERKVGDVIANSKSNPDRLDIRDFPEFDSEEYNDLPDAGGVCCYDIDHWEKYIDLEDAVDSGYHVYVVSGDDYFEGEDYDEMVIKGAVVEAVVC